MAEYTVERDPLGNLSKTQSMVLAAMIFAVALVLSLVENMMPPLPIAVPGVKFGLSNIAVMYALFFLGKKQAYLIAVLKGGFVFITRGIIAGALSLSGGILSITVMLLLLVVFREKISYLSISIFGAVSHNIGQFLVIILLYTGMNILPYLPVLLISGVIAGIVTSTLLRFIMPALKRLV
ncbi:MAG: Gx transporter family protein [Clostridiales bacterium]|nr:Gx transporter family protein [Clostridiales bacterium]